MNKRSSGLGRGLGALIPSGGAMSTAAGASLTELPVAAVIPNRFQPREHFDEEALASLTASIREMGVLQPILVRPRSTITTRSLPESGGGAPPSAPDCSTFRRSSARSRTPQPSSTRWSRTSIARTSTHWRKRRPTNS